jgi:hypothetical protein
MYDWLLYGGLGVLAKCLWDFLSDALDRRHDRKYAERRAHIKRLTPELDVIIDAAAAQKSQALTQALELIRTAGAPEGYSAAQILGHHDGGARWHPPAFCPEAQTSAEALAAWDRRTDGAVA